MSWRQAQEYEFSQSSLRRGTEIMAKESGQAQAWMFDLFDFAWDAQ
jgi:hypothetical protein